jgi:NADPH2:quinone reductase
MTACHAVLGDGSVRDQMVLVTGGAGAVGHYAIQFAKWSGATVIATVSGSAKARHARHAGADFVINYREEDVAAQVREITDGGVDRIIEVEFGGNIAVTAQILKAGGVVAAYASSAAPAPMLPFYPLMFQHATLHLMLVYRLSAAQRTRAIEHIQRALREGCLRHAVGARFSLDDTAAAHRAVESGTLIGNAIVELASSGHPV